MSRDERNHRVTGKVWRYGRRWHWQVTELFDWGLYGKDCRTFAGSSWWEKRARRRGARVLADRQRLHARAAARASAYARAEEICVREGGDT